MIVKAMMLNVIVIFRSDCESNDVVESKEIMLMMLDVKMSMQRYSIDDCESNDVECHCNLSC